MRWLWKLLPTMTQDPNWPTVPPKSSAPGKTLVPPPVVFPDGTPTPEMLVAAHGELSATAGILANVQRLLRRDDTTTSDIAELLRLDAALASRLVRISNSTFFKRGQSCSSLEDALIRIGFAEINEVVSLVAGAALISKPLHAYGKSALRFWHEAVGCAVAASLIAERLDEDVGTAYTAGLFHLLGRPAMDAYLRQKKPDVFLEDAGFPVNYVESERLALGFSQSLVAALFLEQLKFPQQLVDSVRLQDESILSGTESPRMRYVLTAARMLYEEEFGDRRGAPACAEAVLNLVQLPMGAYREIEPRFKASIERAIQISYY
jgi:HD-like signal output (HDOD) protein